MVAGGRNPRQAEFGEGGAGTSLEGYEGVSWGQVCGPQKDLELSPGKEREAGEAAPHVCWLPAHPQVHSLRGTWREGSRRLAQALLALDHTACSAP